jgi:hypothetical protein
VSFFQQNANDQSDVLDIDLKEEIPNQVGVI